MKIGLEAKGDYNKTENYLKKLLGKNYFSKVNSYGAEGVAALSVATPLDTGETANSWYYEVEEENGRTKIYWANSHVEQGWANIALLLQYGHGTGTGGYVPGRDYINPAMAPIFDKIPDDIEREVRGL